ncbi:peptidoglycan-binding domain-containing protein [Streptomyces griseus]|uniref:peptidoglycan-binding domain-containing protein n=1 Tax=Streptomyces griseus TaxID=1911 RepID=UPI000840860D|nr:peptidoglycan-binding domain-containing protein [Streptomyces griseus]
MRTNIVTALTAAALIAGTVAAPAAFAGTTTAQAYTCHYSEQGVYTYAGYYGGNTVIPSSTGVSSAGIEAQCLLRAAGFDPGTIDGVFGANSKAAAKAFQSHVNDRSGYHVLDVDGIVGSDTWPELRYYVGAHW